MVLKVQVTRSVTLNKFMFRFRHQTLLLSFCLLLCQSMPSAADTYSTAIATRPSDGWKIVHRFIDKLEQEEDKSRFPIRMTMIWQYDGNNGMPAKPQTTVLYQLEDDLMARVDNQRRGRLAQVSTGNNQRIWIYYVKSEADFRQLLKPLTSKYQLELTINSAEDTQWQQHQRFLDSLSR